MSRLRKFLVTQKNVNRVSSDESSIKVETNVDRTLITVRVINFKQQGNVIMQDLEAMKMIGH